LGATTLGLLSRAVSSHVTVDRLQFTLTVTFHYLFPILTMGSALFALVLLTAHGASFPAAFASGELAVRAGRLARAMWWAELALVAAIAYPAYRVREDMLTAFGDHRWRLVFPAVTLGALAAAFAWRRREAWKRAFAASCGFIAGLLAITAAALHPSLLPAREGSPFGLTVHNAASGDQALRTALFSWPVGIALAGVYFALAYRHFVLRRDPRAGEAARGVSG
jgi:cytochrome d ubiquinol oxidase subunit II